MKVYQNAVTQFSANNAFNCKTMIWDNIERQYKVHLLTKIADFTRWALIKMLHVLYARQGFTKLWFSLVRSQSFHLLKC